MTGLQGDTRVMDRGRTPRAAHRFDDVRQDLDDRVAIELLVRNFYREAAKDSVLGPVFEAARVNWHAHIATLVDFWAWQLLGEPGYVGQPLPAHEPEHARTPLGRAQYERWAALFSETVDAWFAGPIADAAKTHAQKMASAMDGDRDASVEPVWRLAVSA